MRRTLTIAPLALVVWVTMLSAARGGTVAFWRFENGTAGAAAVGDGSILDSSGNGLNGTPFGGPVYRANVPVNPVPRTGRANTLSMDFNALNRVFVPDDPKLHLTHSLTIEAYINVAFTPAPGSLPAQIVFRGDDRPGFDPYFLGLVGNDLAFSVQDASNQSAAAMAPLPARNQWIHVAGTLDDATGKLSLYINGSLANSLTTSVRPLGALDPTLNPGLGIGDLQSATYPENFYGLIDEVRISDQALSPDQFLSAVPEPSAVILAGAGLAVLSLRRRR